MNKYLRIAIGFLLSAFFLWLSFRNIDRATFKEALFHIDLRWTFFAFVIYLFSHILRSFRWSLLLSPLTPVTPWLMFPFVMFGFLVNNLLPGRVGEIAKSVAVGRRFPVPTAEVLGTVAIERLGDLVGLMATMLVAIRVFEPARKAFPTVLGSLLGGIAVLGLGFYVLKKMEHLISPQSWIGRLLAWIEKVFVGMKAASSPRVLISVALLSIGIWWIEAATLMISSRAFGLSLNPFEAAATLTGISMGVMIPASPGFVGTYEFFGKEALRLLGYQPNMALVFIGFHHIFQIIICSLMGLPVLFKIGSLRPDQPRS